MYEYDAKVTNVVDGDTIDCIVSLPFYLTATHRFRLLGVNCPEVHGATKAEGLKAAAYTRATLLGKTVRLRSAKSDDFGRWLCQIYVGDIDFNQSLIDRGLAVPYMVSKFAGPEAAAGDEPEDDEDEVERLRGRAERVERERNALIEASLTQNSDGRWGAFLGDYAIVAFDSRDAAIRELFECLGLDAAPAGEETLPDA
jgi:micrococcal nuclease